MLGSRCDGSLASGRGNNFDHYFWGVGRVSDLKVLEGYLARDRNVSASANRLCAQHRLLAYSSKLNTGGDRSDNLKVDIASIPASPQDQASRFAK